MHIENLKELEDSNNNCYLVFDVNVRAVLRTLHQKSYDDEEFPFSEKIKTICQDILWVDSNFDANLTRDCDKLFHPQLFMFFLDNFLQGSKITSLHKQLTQSTLTTSKLIVKTSVKRIQQKVKTTNKIHYSRVWQSPLGVYLGMLMHATRQKKGLIEKLRNIDMSISNKHVM